MNKLFPCLVMVAVLVGGCHTTKFIDRVDIQKDTTALHERDSILRVKKEDSVYYKNLIESASSADVIFLDTAAARIEYYPDGSIAVIEGRVKSLNNKLSKSLSESGFWQRKFDSLAQVTTKDSVKIKYQVLAARYEKKVSFIPWWVIVLFILSIAVAVIGWMKGKIKFPL